MEAEFIPYEQSLALKELGFDKPCFWYYVLETNGDYKLYNKCEVKTYFTYIEAPLYQQAFRWFREKHTLYGTIRYGNNEFDKSIYLFPCINGIISGNDSFETQEEAELECLKKLIEIVKENK